MAKIDVILFKLPAWFGLYSSTMMIPSTTLILFGTTPPPPINLNSVAFLAPLAFLSGRFFDLSFRSAHLFNFFVDDFDGIEKYLKNVEKLFLS